MDCGNDRLRFIDSEWIDFRKVLLSDPQRIQTARGVRQVRVVLVSELEGAAQRANAVVVGFLRLPSLDCRKLHQFGVQNTFEVPHAEFRAPTPVEDLSISHPRGVGHVVSGHAHLAVSEEGVEDIIARAFVLALTGVGGISVGARTARLQGPSSVVARVCTRETPRRSQTASVGFGP